MYQNIDDSLKTAIQMTSIQLNTADGSPMTALGMTTLQLGIADFKFSHNFIIGHWLLLIGAYPWVSVVSLAVIGGYL